MSLETRLADEAAGLGFAAFGIATVMPSSTTASYRDWLDHGYAGTMQYLHRHAPLKADPRTLLPEARSVIVVAARYDAVNEGGGVSAYAQGKDYHDVLRSKLRQLEAILKSEGGSHHTRICVDSAPMPEREWAVRAGLGWIGKNANLISESAGCCLFLAELLTDLQLTPSATAGTDRCGTCRACLDACPTAAILPNRTVDATRCISYLTIEHHGELSAEQAAMTGQWLFGCDACTAICPWNRHGRDKVMPELSGSCELTPNAILSMDAAGFKERFNGTPLLRTGLARLQRNARATLANQAASINKPI